MSFEQFKRIVECLGFPTDDAEDNDGLFSCPTKLGLVTSNSIGTVNIKRKRSSVSKAGFVRFNGIKFLQDRGAL